MFDRHPRYKTSLISSPGTSVLSDTPGVFNLFGMENFNELLDELQAPKGFKKFAKKKTIEKLVNDCPKGKWLLFLAHRLNVDSQRLTLAKGLCGGTVSHMMRNDHSLNAINSAIKYGEGEITAQDLNDADNDAREALIPDKINIEYEDNGINVYKSFIYENNHPAAVAACFVADINCQAEQVAIYTAKASANFAGYNAALWDCDESAVYEARMEGKSENEMKTANICREMIGFEIIEKVNELLEE